LFLRSVDDILLIDIKIGSRQFVNVNTAYVYHFLWW